jgi:hypothetical protein
MFLEHPRICMNLALIFLSQTPGLQGGCSHEGSQTGHTTCAEMERAKVAAEELSQRLESEAAAGLHKLKVGMGVRLQRAEEDGIEAESRALEAEDRALQAENKATEVEQALAETLASLKSPVGYSLLFMSVGSL